ncbi:glycosyltransferase family 8 protein [Helicobacter sp. 23-1046]
MPSNNTKQIIPIMHCFNDDYVIPASVSFVSMLENANPSYSYKLFVLHTDISETHQNTLHSIVSRFENASLEFIDMSDRFKREFDKMKMKAHYAKEMLYKFLAPTIFKKYEYIIITDVDVVFCGDIAEIYHCCYGGGEQFDEYIAGISYPNILDNFMRDTYGAEFSSEEQGKLLIGGGLLCMNLKKMREDNMETKCVAYFEQNLHRLKQAEQDVLNLVLHPKIKLLPTRAMVCTYLYDMLDNDKFFGNEQKLSEVDKSWIKEATKNPIQLHYAGGQKPWNAPNCTKDDVWFGYLFKTPCFYELMKKLATPKLPNCRLYLFGKIEILKVKNGKIRLFGFIPITKIQFK